MSRHFDCLVLGAGIVGVSTALHLQQRGRSVALIDTSPPGSGTSYGNAGVIQREAVRPHPFPRDLRTLLNIALQRDPSARYDLLSLPHYVRPLLRYWYHSAPRRYAAILDSYVTLIRHSLSEHDPLIERAGIAELIARQGYLFGYRDEQALAADLRKAEDTRRRFGVGYALLDGAGIRQREPALRLDLAGALHWVEPWTVRDPGRLVQAYADLFEREGGALLQGDALSLSETRDGWQVTAAGDAVGARDAVVALGPWSMRLLGGLGYRFPLFIKRGYHMHYGYDSVAPLKNWLLDRQFGYLVTPQSKGIRLTSGAEFSRHANPPTPFQIDASERRARELIHLGDRLEAQPWMGARMCSPDMRPILGRAPKHRGLWLNIGHSHHGLTLGPVTGRLVAEAITGEPALLDMSPFAAERFM